MNIIETVREILEKFPKISEVVGEVHIDFADPSPTSYGLSSVGDSVLKTDILGNEVRQHTFMLYTTYSSVNDYERLNNSSALTELGAWLSEQKNIPAETECAGKIYGGRVMRITAQNGMLYSVPQENETDGVQYQMQIIAEYSVIKEDRNEADNF